PARFRSKTVNRSVRTCRARNSVSRFRADVLGFTAVSPKFGSDGTAAFPERRSAFDPARVVPAAVLATDPTALVLDHQFGRLVAGELAGPLDGVGLAIVQRIRSLRAVRLHRPA